MFLLLTTLIMFLMNWELLCFLSEIVRLVFVSNFSCETHYVSYKLFLINHNECILHWDGSPCTCSRSVSHSTGNNDRFHSNDYCQIMKETCFWTGGAKCWSPLAPTVAASSGWKGRLSAIRGYVTITAESASLIGDITAIILERATLHSIRKSCKNLESSFNKPKYTKSLITVTASLLTSLLTFCDQPGFMP